MENYSGVGLSRFGRLNQIKSASGCCLIEVLLEFSETTAV